MKKYLAIINTAVFALLVVRVVQNVKIEDQINELRSQYAGLTKQYVELAFYKETISQIIRQNAKGEEK